MAPDPAGLGGATSTGDVRRDALPRPSSPCVLSPQQAAVVPSRRHAISSLPSLEFAPTITSTTRAGPTVVALVMPIVSAHLPPPLPPKLVVPQHVAIPPRTPHWFVPPTRIISQSPAVPICAGTNVRPTFSSLTRWCAFVPQHHSCPPRTTQLASSPASMNDGVDVPITVGRATGVAVVTSVVAAGSWPHSPLLLSPKHASPSEALRPHA
ncbi:MAG: hypothetical protein KF773_37000 [Deltaproteobacteria bacterium]|nr:hypothetical protein [Deltaproteobacteria bacterium]